MTTPPLPQPLGFHTAIISMIITPLVSNLNDGWSRNNSLITDTLSLATTDHCIRLSIDALGNYDFDTALNCDCVCEDGPGD